MVDYKHFSRCFCYISGVPGSGYLYVLFVSDLRQELAVRQKERRPSSSLGKDTDRVDAPYPLAGSPSILATPSKPINSFATPPASIRRGKWKHLYSSNDYGNPNPIYLLEASVLFEVTV